MTFSVFDCDCTINLLLSILYITWCHTARNVRLSNLLISSCLICIRNYAHEKTNTETQINECAVYITLQYKISCRRAANVFNVTNHRTASLRCFVTWNMLLSLKVTRIP